MIAGYWAGRRVILTTLDPVPPMLRCGPGVIVMNERECQAVRDGAESETRRIAKQLREYELLQLATRLNEAAQ